MRTQYDLPEWRLLPIGPDRQWTTYYCAALLLETACIAHDDTDRGRAAGKLYRRTGIHLRPEHHAKVEKLERAMARVDRLARPFGAR